MSGLIWAGIGKGIADAGQTFAGYMAKDIEATRLEEREALREERLLKRQEALEQLKADRKLADEEALRKRVATESVEIQSRAAGAPARRESAALGRDAQTLAKSSAQAGEEDGMSVHLVIRSERRRELLRPHTVPLEVGVGEQEDKGLVRLWKARHRCTPRALNPKP